MNWAGYEPELVLGKNYSPPINRICMVNFEVLMGCGGFWGLVGVFLGFGLLKIN